MTIPNAADYMMWQGLLAALHRAGFAPEDVDNGTIIVTLYDDITYELTLKRRVTTSGGVELTDEVMDGLAEEAAAGYDVGRLHPRRPGDPAVAVHRKAALRSLIEGQGDHEQIDPAGDL